MTSTETAEKAAETIREPLPLDEVDAEAAYLALRRLLGATGVVLADVAKNSSELYRHLDALAEAHAVAQAVLFPPPPPTAPSDATVLYAHAVEPGDLVWLDGAWERVKGKEAGVYPGEVRFLVQGARRYTFKVMEPLPVVRPTVKAPDEQEGQE